MTNTMFQELQMVNNIGNTFLEVIWLPYDKVLLDISAIAISREHVWVLALLGHDELFQILNIEVGVVA